VFITEYIKVSELKPHKRNDEFFDDITGEAWEEFKESIRTLGVVEPIVITPDKTIVSGHQRVRACKELGIDEVLCDMRSYDSEDQVLQALIETNIRQRGIVGGSAKKVAKRIKALEDIYGIQHGNNQHSRSGNNFQSSISQEELGEKLGMSTRTMRNYMMLLDMIPELEDLVDTGIVSTTTAVAIVRELSPEDQKSFIESLPEVEKLTEKKARELMASYKAEQENSADYEEVKQELARTKKETRRLNDQNHDIIVENQKLEKRIKELESETPEAVHAKKLEDGVFTFEAYCRSFITNAGGYVWLAEEIGNFPEELRKRYLRAVANVSDWAYMMEQNIEKSRRLDG